MSYQKQIRNSRREERLSKFNFNSKCKKYSVNIIKLLKTGIFSKIVEIKDQLENGEVSDLTLKNP